MKNKSNQAGFSLIELLVVVIIIGIIAAIAIPSLLSSRRAANEASAVSNLRTVHTANATYAATQNDDGYLAGDLAALNGTERLLDASWAAATVKKNTYTFVYTPNPNATAATGYCLTAKSDDAQAKSFAIGTDGVIHQADGNSITCVFAANGSNTFGGTNVAVKGS